MMRYPATLSPHHLVIEQKQKREMVRFAVQRCQPYISLSSRVDPPESTPKSVGTESNASQISNLSEVGSLLCALSSGRAKAAWLSAHTLTQTGTLAKPQTTPSRNRVIPINGGWGVPPGWALYSTQRAHEHSHQHWQTAQA